MCAHTIYAHTENPNQGSGDSKKIKQEKKRPEVSRGSGGEIEDMKGKEREG